MALVIIRVAVREKMLRDVPGPILVYWCTGQIVGVVCVEQKLCGHRLLTKVSGAIPAHECTLGTTPISQRELKLQCSTTDRKEDSPDSLLCRREASASAWRTPSQSASAMVHTSGSTVCSGTDDGWTAVPETDGVCIGLS